MLTDGQMEGTVTDDGDGDGVSTRATPMGPPSPEPGAGLSFAPEPPPPPPPLPLGSAQPGASSALTASSGRSIADESRDVRYETLKNEVDALQVLVMKQQQPWYRDAASIVAVLALMFSFGTTIVSYQRASQEDVHAAEIELRALLTRLSAIPAEMTQNAKTYADDPGAVASLASVLTQEQILLAKQAAQVLLGIPAERVTAAQYLAVANVLITNGIDTEGLPLLDAAIQVARDVNDYTSAARVKAYRVFQLGRYDEGRDLYQRALNVWNLRGPGFQSQDPRFRDYTDLQTHIGWAQAELSVGNCDEAQAQIDEARKLSPRFAATDTQVRRMEAVEAALPGCHQGIAAPSPSPSAGG
jgi:tetratricopeptide (TPR) repeat protein